MEFLSLTHRPEIGANSYALRMGERVIILDAGMHPKEEGRAALPHYEKLEGLIPSAILITHAHQDHIGSLPVLTRHFPDTPVYMTEETAVLTDVMLHNSVNVMQRKQDQRPDEAVVHFTHRGVDLSRQMWRPWQLDRKGPLDEQEHETGELDEQSFTLHNAGHILGSAGVVVRAEGKTLLYTGDVNFHQQTLMNGADFPTEGVDILVMETTRGDSPMPEDFTRAKEEERFLAAILEGLERGGVVFIPVFALGKTQEVLALFHRFKQEGRLPSIPLYIGGLSTKVTSMYDRFAHTSRRNEQDLQLLQELAPYVVTGRDADSMEPRPKAIYALSSGMMTEETVSNVFARKILPGEKNSIFFVGYSDPQSPAGALRAAEPGSDFMLNSSREPVPFRCVRDSFNFSAHSSREELRDFAIRLAPKKILLVHGDQPASAWFQSELSRALPESDVIIPESGNWIDLS